MKKIIAVSIIMAALSLTSTVFAAELNGFIADKNGKPVTDAKIILKDAKGAQSGEPAISDAKGAYAFKDIKPGQYQVVISEKNNWKIFIGPGETRRDFSVK